MLSNMFFQAKWFLNKFCARQEKGQGLIEYALIILLIVALSALGPVVSNVFDRISANLEAIP
jgi:Flp pilus assembly pilin Flp